MPRKQEPTVIAVLDYFETAPLEAAKLALQLAGRAVRGREPKAAKEKTPSPAALPVPRRRAQGTTQAPPAGTPPAPAEPAPPTEG
jgi:hypothetical protein